MNSDSLKPSSRFASLLKWLAAIFLFLCFSVFTLAYLHGVAERNASIIMARGLLSYAAKDFQELGYVTNVSSSHFRFWLSTNVATIGGTQYNCYAEIGGGMFGDQGTLAITTNQIFIWLDRKYPPKIIDSKYKAPLFPSRY